MRATAVVFGFPPELGDKMPLLKALHILITAHGEIKLVLLRKHPPYWLALIVPEGSFGGKKPSTVLLSHEPVNYTNDWDGKTLGVMFQVFV